jgi:hypothetical protein
MNLNYKILLTLPIFCVCASAHSQQYRTDTLPRYKTLSAGPEYKTSSFHQWLWGTNYRTEWSTPIKVPVVLLDTLKGGLKPKKAGGGHQTRSLHLETKADKDYTMRSVNKSLGKVLPKAFLGTFIEDLVDDKVSMSHPYGAGAVPYMAGKAGVYHTNPSFVYLPKQPALDSFNEMFGNEMFLFDQRVNGNWEEEPSLGSFKDFISTTDLVDKIKADNKIQVDQKQFVRSRLFDMFINDWDRHEDQWEWGAREKNGEHVYQPVPQDRDQVFFKYNGVLLKAMIGASGIKYFQALGDRLPDVNNFNFEERYLDRLFSNELTLTDWQQIAKDLQAHLTDAVIETSVKQLPPEIYAVSGQKLVNTLKERRKQIPEYATTYYRFIAKEVDVPGSSKDELFELVKLDNHKTQLNISRIGKNKTAPYYSRVFSDDETNEIRVYGIGGNDKFRVNGQGKNDIKIRTIGGIDKDSFFIATHQKVQVYDNNNNVFIGTNKRLHLSEDTTINSYKYGAFQYNKSGISPTIFYTNEDRLFVGLTYRLLQHKWRKEPFASDQRISANYSISQKAFSVIYNGLFPKAIANWDLNLYGDYDQVRWTNFFGLGNETAFTVKDINYYRTRTEEWNAKAGITRLFGRQRINVNGLFKSIRVIRDDERYVAKNINSLNPETLNGQRFGGGQLQYIYQYLNDSIVPTKGVSFLASGTYLNNIEQQNRRVAQYAGDLQLFIPIVKSLSFAIRGGAATVTGTPEFYQYVSIGGPQTVRAFRRDRFWGKSAVYNSNEIRLIRKVKSYLYNGKLGLGIFYDNGRVWMPNETSDTWHHGYGAGLILAPFNAIQAEVTYGISKDENLIQLKISKAL